MTEICNGMEDVHVLTAVTSKIVLNINLSNIMSMRQNAHHLVRGIFLKYFLVFENLFQVAQSRQRAISSWRLRLPLWLLCPFLLILTDICRLSETETRFWIRNHFPMPKHQNWNNKYLYRQSQGWINSDSGVKWAECLLNIYIGTGYQPGAIKFKFF